MTRMQSATTVVQKPLTGKCYCTDNELMAEVVEAVMNEVGDVRADTGFIDQIRHQASFKLEDGRTMRLTFMFE